jgi:hypothetical protein
VGTSNTGAIPDSWMNNQSSVTSVILANNNSVTSIGNSSFQGTGLRNIGIPSSVTSIGNLAFYFCFRSQLVDLNISNVTSLGNRAFRECTKLATIVLSNSLAAIDYETFQNCSSLASITIPNSVTSIGQAAFSNCYGLSTININSAAAITSIGSSAFSNCNTVSSINIPINVSSIGTYAFSSCLELSQVNSYAPRTAFNNPGLFYGCYKLGYLNVRAADNTWTAGQVTLNQITELNTVGRTINVNMADATNVNAAEIEVSIKLLT